MYVLRAMRNRGLPPDCLNVIFAALILSRIMYGVCAWGGFITAAQHCRLNKVLIKCRRYQYCTSTSVFEDLLVHADSVLFRKVQSSIHCLNHMLPAIRSSVRMLRDRGHPFTLPVCERELFKRSFIVRCLYSQM